jgi:hypothetical protein
VAGLVDLVAEVIRSQSFKDNVRKMSTSDWAGERSAEASMESLKAGCCVIGGGPAGAASDGAARDQFGFSVSVSGDTAVIGSPQENSAQGSARIFRGRRRLTNATHRELVNEVITQLEAHGKVSLNRVALLYH